MIHTPVLQKEVIEYLKPKPNENFIDCTIGGGGHTLEILKKNGPKGKVLGIESDSYLYERLKEEYLKQNLKERLILVNDSFVNLKEIVKREKFGSVSGILFDLGFSSWHLEESKRGFSFLRKEELDMRYSLENPLTAEKIVNYWSLQDIEKVLREYGEERFANKISKKIIATRKVKSIKDTFHLTEIIKEATPLWYQRQKIHSATRTFQALRIAVNNELKNLEQVLPQTMEILSPGAKLVIISFHSLEDRLVKNFFKKQAEQGLLKILTKKPAGPTKEEINLNRRSRSAKLRAAEKSN